MNIAGWQWLIILAIVLLLFGATKLPKLARSLGESTRIFKSEVHVLRQTEHSQEESGTEGGEGEVLDSGSSSHRRSHQR
ncbi:twin-arginine translocase TatA/TatE family subunit [Nesterenkonia ebinurensis]|uniref:twin-arginine translocase TatA/TatE family subunit n=1 Tax=Nesterenkonia ebinurensis TaxID=2608252 RepID=UPI00123CD507|nr:twin-arginine translocase TatA/TatE family subunit [Nesterenkonia ebinurensis]